MPTYEYRCITCGQHIEAVQSFSDDPLTECGACGGLLRKVFSPVGIVFKGSGFYKTDSRSGSKSASVPEGKKDRESKTDSSGGTSSGGASSGGAKSESSSGTDAKIA